MKCQNALPLIAVAQNSSHCHASPAGKPNQRPRSRPPPKKTCTFWRQVPARAPRLQVSLTSSMTDLISLHSRGWYRCTKQHFPFAWRRGAYLHQTTRTNQRGISSSKEICSAQRATSWIEFPRSPAYVRFSSGSGLSVSPVTSPSSRPFIRRLVRLYACVLECRLAGELAAGS